ncbi:peptide deformylase [Patescibacteria group bacterium]
MKEIVQKENLVLRDISQEVSIEEIDSKEIQNLIKEMHQSLATQDDGVALAAPQIGENLRIFVISPRVFDPENEQFIPKEKSENLVYINPKIIKTSKKQKWVDEGCLSVRQYYGRVKRLEKVTVKAYNEKGEAFTRGASGLLAQIFQHEIDHLNGVLFTDKAKNIEKIQSQENEK